MAAHTNVGTVRLIATDTWHELVELASPMGNIDALAFSPDGATLATLSRAAGEVTLWNAHDGSLSRTVVVGPPNTSPFAYGDSLQFSSDGTRLATSAQTLVDMRTLSVAKWSRSETETDRMLESFGTRAIHFVDDGRKILAYGGAQLTNMVSGQALFLTDLETGERTTLVSNNSGSLPYVVSEDGRWLAYNGSHRNGYGLLLFDTSRRDPIAIDTFVGLTPLAFSQDRTELYTTTQNEIEVLEVPTLKSLRRFRWSFGARFLGSSPEGLLVAATEKTTEWWDPVTGMLVRSLPFPLREARWSADGVVGGGAGLSAPLHVWLEEDGRERCRIAPLDGALPKLRPRPAIQPPTPSGPTFGPWIASQSDDGALIIMMRYAGHFASTDWHRTTIEEVATKKVLRDFGMSYVGGGYELSGDGMQAITSESSALAGGAVYMSRWCR